MSFIKDVEMCIRDRRWFKVGLGIEDIGVLDLEIEGC